MSRMSTDAIRRRSRDRAEVDCRSGTREQVIHSSIPSPAVVRACVRRGTSAAVCARDVDVDSTTSAVSPHLLVVSPVCLYISDLLSSSGPLVPLLRLSLEDVLYLRAMPRQPRDEDERDSNTCHVSRVCHRQEQFRARKLAD